MCKIGWFASQKVILLSVLLMPLCGSRTAQQPGFEIGLSENRSFHRTRNQIYRLAASHHYVEAISRYHVAIAQARAARDVETQRKLLNNLGACEMALFQYQSALTAFEEARQLPVQAQEVRIPAGLNSNISSLFLQLGNYPAAEAAAKRGLSLLPPVGQSDIRAKLLIQLAAVQANRNEMASAQLFFAQGIDAAYDAADPESAAWAWEHLGDKYLELGRVRDADRVLTESFRIRTEHGQSRVDSAWELAMVRAEERDFRSAEVLLGTAVQELKRKDNQTPPWTVYGARGRVRVLAGNLPGALADLRIAQARARSWRVAVVGNDANRTITEAGLSEKIFSSFIEAGNRLAIDTGDNALARETFEASEENRAASLRALVPQASDWRRNLPDQYWELLKASQASELRQLGEDRQSAEAARLKDQLEQMEAAAGAPAAGGKTAALAQTQKALDSDSVLFSFHLGEKDSWLWAVTQRGFAMYRLPGSNIIVPQIHTFTRQVQEDSGLAEESGGVLYQTLFGSVSQKFTQRKRWLLALDADLFPVPFAALPAGGDASAPVYLGQAHTIQIASGALMLGAAQQQFPGEFLAIGDPIYNHADARWTGAAQGSRRFRNMFSFEAWSVRASSSPAFARLWGTGEEVRSCARQWNAPKTVLLTGSQATKARLWAELQAKPSVIHFATHILEPRETLPTGWIALSLGANDEPEFVEPAEISARTISARLVVLSGCSSGAAEVRAASGLMGLTRAFIAAGAGNVLATHWPTIDDNGEFLASFYRSLREHPNAGPAAALTQARLEAIGSGNWRSHPSFWASYFLMGNETN